MNTILIVEDNGETCTMLAAALEEAGYAVHCVGTVRESKAFLSRNCPMLVILDIWLPDGHGLEICRWARGMGRLANVPIIALTGDDELPSKTKGFLAGVDQYLIKPIDMAELVIWVKALLRRVDMDKSGGAVLTAGDLQLEVSSRLVKYKNRPLDDLTSREFDLLYALVKNSPRILSRDEILSGVWHTAAVENLVDTHLFNLRSKLPQEVSCRIQAVAGKGFRYYNKD